MPQSKSEKIVRQVLRDLWNDGKPASIDKLYDEKCKLTSPGANFKGRDAVQQYIGMYHEGFPDLNVDFQGFYPDESDTGGVLHWKFSGTHKGTIMGIEPTNKKVSIEGMTLSRMRNGKITEEHFLWDRLEQAKQLGIPPEKLRAENLQM